MYKKLYRISLVVHAHVRYNIIYSKPNLNERQSTQMKKRIKISEIEEIKYQSDRIAGLSSILAVFLDFTKEDEHLKDALECLMNETFKMQDNCKSLLEKFSTAPLNQ